MNIKKDDHFKLADLIVQIGQFLFGAEAMLNIMDHLIAPQLAGFYEAPGFFQFCGFKHFLHSAAKASLLAVSINPKQCEACNRSKFNWSIIESGIVLCLIIIIENVLQWPVVAMTLLCCYIVLYKTLTLLAVILRYPERSFCGEWWNVTESKDYWAKWNLPVHEWLIKHLYRPCREAGVPTLISALVTFIFSGLLHDYAVGIFYHLQLEMPNICCHNICEKRCCNCLFFVDHVCDGSEHLLLGDTDNDLLSSGNTVYESRQEDLWPERIQHNHTADVVLLCRGCNYVPV